MKVDARESGRSIAAQHQAIRVAMVRMCTVGSRVAAGRRTGGGNGASQHRSSVSAMDGIGGAVGGGESLPSAMRGGEASEAADGGAAG